MVAVQKVDARPYCDPTITANIYCQGLTDRLIYSAIRPFWQEALSVSNHLPLRLWLMRYRRCGQHLKVRIHAPESAKQMLKELLQRNVNTFFEAIPEADRPIPVDYQIGAGDIPIDVEDGGDSNYPDCLLLWTNYRRSFVSLGSLPFLEDDHYVDLFTRCLSEATGSVLREYHPNKKGEFTNTARQVILMKGLVEGLSALGWVEEKAAQYLAYHRDWLIRFAIFKSKTNAGKATEILEHFDKRTEGMQPLRERVLNPLAQAYLISSTAKDDHPEQTPWQESLRALLDYVSPLCVNGEYQADPYAPNPAFPAPFKVFHGFANQLGIRFLEEAFSHHLLLSCLPAKS